MRKEYLKRRGYLGVFVGGIGALAGCPGTDDPVDRNDSTATESAQSRSGQDEPNFAVTEVTVSKETVTVGEPVEVSALVSNTGDTGGGFEIQLEAREVTITEEIQLSAAEETQIKLSPTFEEPGTVDIAVNDVAAGTVAVEERQVYHVAKAGANSNTGAESDPLQTIHEAFQRAGPGDTIKVASGEYEEEHAPGEPLRTIRHGEPDAPITITGPEDAVVRPGLQIRHSHIRLTGLTFEALHDPDNPDDPDSYADYPIDIRPLPDSEQYLEDIVCAPHGVGYSAYALIRVLRTKDLEIGPLRVTGLAGASWVLPDEPDRHAGEIIYLGAPPGMLDQEDDDYPWPGIDQTRNVHIHHIDNSEGHPHSELVDAKIGTRDILVEYCTDSGGSQNTETAPAQAVNFNSTDATLRWCRLENGQGRAVIISGDEDWIYEQDGLDIPPETIGTNHSIYGNEINGFPDADLMIQLAGPDDQAAICGNDMDSVHTMSHEHPPTKVDYDPEQACSEGLPAGDGIGHTGGDSPWE